MKVIDYERGPRSSGNTARALANAFYYMVENQCNVVYVGQAVTTSYYAFYDMLKMLDPDIRDMAVTNANSQWIRFKTKQGELTMFFKSKKYFEENHFNITGYRVEAGVLDYD